VTVIYALCDPDTMEVRYIGKARDMGARLRSHRFEGKNARTHKGAALATPQVAAFALAGAVIRAAYRAALRWATA